MNSYESYAALGLIFVFCLSVLVSILSHPRDVTTFKEFQRWRLICLTFGFVLLMLTPVVSSWVPFYYSSALAIGVFLAIIIRLFQVSIFVLVGIALAEASLGYRIVQEFIISEYGSLDVGATQFVKRAMWIIVATIIFQRTLDTPLAMGALVSCLAICFLITSFEWNGPKSGSGGRSNAKQNCAKFLGRSGKVGPRGTLWDIPSRSPAWSSSSGSTDRVTRNQQYYYSTFHNISNRKKFSKKEWEDFTQKSTQQALTELASSPAFIEWTIKQARK